MSTLSQKSIDSANGCGSGQSVISRDQSLAAPSQSGNHEDDLILLTPYPVEPGHTLLSILRLASHQWRPEMKANAAHIAGGDKAGIIINKPASIMDYNKAQAAQNERIQPPSAKLSFKVLMTNSETKLSSLEHRTLRFWLNKNIPISNNNNNNEYDEQSDQLKARQQCTGTKQQSSQLAQSYFCNLLGTKPDDNFPKSYIEFIIKLMRILKQDQFSLVSRMEVEIRKLSCEDNTNKSASGSGSFDVQSTPSIGASGVTVGQSMGQAGRNSPLTSQKVLDMIESSYPNPISVKEICSCTQSNEQQVRLLLEELSTKEKIAATGKDQAHYTRTTKPSSDTKIQLVKQMPTVIRAKQPVIAIITSQYYEKLAVDAMISDKETFVRYRTTHGDGGPGGNSDINSSANYVYTLGNIGDHRVVSTKLTSIGHSRGALIAAGNATTRLLGTFPEIEYVFLVGCGGGVPNYTDYASHVRLGDIVISHIPSSLPNNLNPTTPSSSSAKSQQQRISTSSRSGSPDDYVYVHCRAKSQVTANGHQKNEGQQSSIPPSFSVHTNLKRLNSLTGNGQAGDQDHQLSSSSSSSSLSPTSSNQIRNARWFERQNKVIQQQQSGEEETKTAPAHDKPVEYDQCHFRLWRPAKLDIQDLSTFLWAQGLREQKHRIWEYYIMEGVKVLSQQDIDASRPKDDKDKLFMSLGESGTIEVSHPEAADDEVDLRREGHPMCHFGPIGSGMPPTENEQLRQRMITEFGLRCFDMEFDPVVESIYGNCKESYVMIRGISDYQDGRKNKEWQQYAALVAAAFMKSIIVNLKPI